jgi:SAM-dependent methyltransferase
MNFRKLYEVEDLPVFQQFMYDNKESALNCPKSNLMLVEDLSTGLIYNQLFNPELMNYDENYQNEQGLSPTFINHLESVSKIIEQKIGQHSIIEVGCGKGFFLELLQKKEFEITGFDPAYEGSNNSIIKAAFEQKSSFQAKGVILRHVLEHIKNPYEFLENIRLANDGKGKIYIEVPCFDWILKNNAWYDIYYEHVNYFRLSDLKNMFSVVHDFGRLFGDQYIYIVADLASLRIPIYDKNNSIKFPEDFIKNIHSMNENLNPNKKSFVWGVGSKGMIYSLLKRRSGSKIDGIVDINPAKQGKYIPAVGEKVLTLKDAFKKFPEGSNCYVMNSNYLDEIKNVSKNKYNYITI